VIPFGVLGAHSRAVQIAEYVPNLQIMLFQLIPQRIPPDPQQPRRLRLIAARLLQCAYDELPFLIFERCHFRTRHPLRHDRRSVAGRMQILRQVRYVDHVALRHHASVPDHVFQLAHAAAAGGGSTVRGKSRGLSLRWAGVGE